MRILIRLAAVAVLISALGPAVFIRGFLRSVGPLREGQSIPWQFVLAYLVWPAILAVLGLGGGILLLAFRRSGRIGSIVFLILLSGWVLVLFSPNEPDGYLPLWIALPTLALVALPAVGRACR